ncbi:MAG: hypothetical protein OHK93_000274 [Ramalina farinacea]|uniref:Uncharacterized protein n=1 Tax=Ramalina farinacea TaxID=258253 RepID=A0AA43QGD5_9LECA|nr:hypothetical protein [Ramalina farinacea]
MRTSPPPTSFSPPSAKDEIINDPVRSNLQLEHKQIEDPQTYSNTLANRNERPTSSQASTLPADPFKETARASGSVTRTEESRTQEEDSKSHRPHYDVDDFKKLLLTGEKPRHAEQKPAGLAAAAPVSQPEDEEHEDNSENAPVFQAPLSPATSSLNRTGGDTRTRPGTDKEQESLAPSSLPTAERAKPAAPKPRHGRLVTSGAPQTVSFEDPAFSHGSSDDPTTSDLSRPATRDQTPRSPSQRPLPSLPRSCVRTKTGPAPTSCEKTGSNAPNLIRNRFHLVHTRPTNHGRTYESSSAADGRSKASSTSSPAVRSSQKRFIVWVANDDFAPHFIRPLYIVSYRVHLYTALAKPVLGGNREIRSNIATCSFTINASAPSSTTQKRLQSGELYALETQR